MLRNLIIIAVVIIIVVLVRQRMRLGKSTGPRQAGAESMVQCLHCETYVPGDEAVRAGDRHFCCQQHLRDWTDKTR